MTIRELIDRLKTAPDLDAAIYFASDCSEYGYVSLSPVRNVAETSGFYFVETYSNFEIVTKYDDITLLEPDRKEQEQ